MAKLDLGKIKTDKELEEIAKRDLEGKTLKEIAISVVDSDDVDRVISKAGVGYVIEEGYFGIGRNSIAGPDIGHLGVEIKTSPLRYRANGRLTVKEPLSLNIINYREEYKNTNIRESSLYKKNKEVLLVWYIHDKNIKRSEYTVKYVFLWKMTDSVLDDLNGDYLKILEKIKAGQAHHIHQGQHKFLTLCPKHSGTFKDPTCTKSKTHQPFSSEPAEVRAFRLKNSYMNKVIREYLAKEHPDLLEEFAAPPKQERYNQNKLYDRHFHKREEERNNVEDKSKEYSI